MVLFSWVLIMLAMPLVLYGIWLAIHLSFSCFARQSSPRVSQEEYSGKVAILYTTCDDFEPKACESLLLQWSVQTWVFILDDSTNVEERNRIDQWAAERRVTVVRRPDHLGYKAGNINHWLKHYGDSGGYSYALIVDNDNVLPHDFCRKLVSIAQQGSYAFVQGCHTGDAKLDTIFQRLLHPQVQCEWLFQLPARNIIGMPYTMGHGVLINTADLKSVGGYPLLVSEDLALTAMLAERGRKGVVAPSVVSKEGFPQSYAAYWRRRKRWIAADAELIRKMSTILNRNRLGLLAKVDFWMRELRLGVISTFWLLLAAMSLSAYRGLSTDMSFPAMLWLPLIVLLMAPLAPPAIRGNPSHIKGGLFLCLMPFVGAATCALNPIYTWRGIMGRLGFRPTSSRVGPKRNGRLITCWEFLSGLVMIFGGFLSANMILAAIGVAILLSPVMRSRLEEACLLFGGSLFVLLVAGQIIYDLYLGVVPLGHLVAFAGLSSHSM